MICGKGGICSALERTSQIGLYLVLCTISVNVIEQRLEHNCDKFVDPGLKDEGQTLRRLDQLSKRGWGVCVCGVGVGGVGGGGGGGGGGATTPAITVAIRYCPCVQQ